MIQKSQFIPQRTSYALTKTITTSPWATSWQRIYRQVFWLSDGQRTTQRIADLLHKPNERIMDVVDELKVSGYLSVSVERNIIVMNVTLLKQSFEAISGQKAEFAHSFYQRLFSYYPETRALFAQTDMKRQEGSLMATLATVIAAVERGDNLTPTLRELGKRHERYGAGPEHYPLVGGVLLETFHEYLGTSFNQEVQAAWSQAFDIISEQMLIGTQKEQA